MAKKMTIVVAATATAILAGCVKVECDENTDKAWLSHGKECYTKVVEVEGHKYIIMYGIYSGGIIHAASCTCMSK